MMQQDSSSEYNMLYKQLREFDLQQFTGKLIQRGYKNSFQLAQKSDEQQEIVFQELNLTPDDKQKFQDIFKYSLGQRQIMGAPNLLKNKSDNSQPEKCKIIGSEQLSKLQQSKSETIKFEGIVNSVILYQLQKKQELFARTFDKISYNLKVPKIQINDINVETQSISFLVNYNSNDFDSKKIGQIIKEQFIDQLTIQKKKIDLDSFQTFLLEEDHKFEEKFQVIVQFDNEVIIIGLQKNIDEFATYLNQMEQEKQQIHTIQVSNKLIFKQLAQSNLEQQLNFKNKIKIVFTEDNIIQLTSQKKQIQNSIQIINKRISELESQLKITSSEFSRKQIKFIYKNLQTTIQQLEEEQDICINFEIEGEINNLEKRFIFQRNIFQKSLSQMTVQSFDENLNKEIISFLGAEVKKYIISFKLLIPNIPYEELNKIENFIKSKSVKVNGQFQIGNLLNLEIFKNKEAQIKNFLDQISKLKISQTTEQQQQQYQTLSCINKEFYTFDLISIKDSQKKKIEMPVITNKCRPHPRSCITFIDACNQLSKNNYIVCQCGESVKELNDLVKDIRQQAYEQFHPIVEQVQIIQGLFCHKYNRKKKYTDYIQNLGQIMPNFFLSLSSKNQTSNSINELIKNNNGIGNKIEFSVYCLLDKVKIVIPVRIMNCQHLECYELTSLLDYQMKENGQENKNYFKCLFPNCQQILNMQTLEIMIGGLMLDGELLKVINKGYPAQIKFQYDFIKKDFSDGMQLVNGVQIDPFILKFYEEMITADDQKIMNYLEFQSQVQNLVAQVMQCEIPIAIGKLLSMWQYDIKIIYLKNQYRNQVLEFPIRCIGCKDYNKFIDCRNFAAHYLLIKRKCQSRIKCLLCDSEYNCLTKSICNLIYFDQNLISQMVFDLTEYPQYSTLPQFDLSIISFDKLIIKDRIKEPVLLKGCKHLIIKCLTYQEAKVQWQEQKEITCPCGNKTNNFNDLIKDVRAQVYEQFHPSVESVQVVQGILIHQIQRKLRFQNLIDKVNLLEMISLNHLSNSFMQILNKKQLPQNYFYALCLLDKIKITIPVRIIECDHLECYELTSLLSYYLFKKEFGSQNDSSNMTFHCRHPACQNSINISKFEDFNKKLYLDMELLKLLNKCDSSQFKFVYSTQKIIQFDLEMMNYDDSLIKQFYQLQLTEDEKSGVCFDQFLTQVKQVVARLIQSEITPNQKKIQKQEQYQTKIINLIDPITKSLIEFPIRCNECLNNRYIDVKTFAASLILTKIRKLLMYQCPLCGKQYKCISHFYFSFIHCDQNLIFRMLVDSNQLQNEEFKYEGRQYLLEWFKNRQKMKREDFLFQLQANTNDTVEDFVLQRCTINPQKQIEIPLIIKNCPHKSIIDFDSFYREMVKINFKVDQCFLVFCKCSYCTNNAIKNYKESIFYHEAYGEVLAEFQKSFKSQTRMINRFRYDFKTKKFIQRQQKRDYSLIQISIPGPQNIKQKYCCMLDDDEYQAIFQPINFQGGQWLGQIISMEQTLLNQLKIHHSREVVISNLKEFLYSLNENANPTLKKYQFKVTRIEVELNNEDCRLNKGWFYFE